MLNRERPRSNLDFHGRLSCENDAPARPWWLTEVSNVKKGKNILHQMNENGGRGRCMRCLHGTGQRDYIKMTTAGLLAVGQAQAARHSAGLPEPFGVGSSHFSSPHRSFSARHL